ncbi:MAG TPA: hypothetical protein H9783_03825 [Candidatus Limosilactobacillus faecipullorum]|nr:hypothetical protein [Candidatus Limosilactobacillus faecipullorum]
MINNARIIQKLQQAEQSVNFQVNNHHPLTMAEIPAVISEAEQLAKRLKRTGFKFVRAYHRTILGKAFFPT